MPACLTNVSSFSFSTLGIGPFPRHLKNDRQFSLTTGTEIGRLVGVEVLHIAVGRREEPFFL